MRTTVNFLLVFLTAPSSPVAQTLATSAVYGTVTDQSGAPLVGASIEVRGTALIGGVHAARTGTDGVYRFPVLPPGVYEAAAHYPGLSTAARRGVSVPPGAAIRIDLELQLAPIDQKVNVEGIGPSVDVRNSSIATRIDQSFLSHLPTRRSLGEILDMAPGVVRNTEAGGAAYGGTVSSNAIFVEGVDVTEPRRQRVWMPLNYNWIQQAEISALGADVRYGKFTGASAAIVLRSGGSVSSGLGEYWTTRQKWVDDNSGNGTPRRVAALWDVSGQVGGPIVQDRLWYFGGVEYYRLADAPAGYRGTDVTSTRTPRTALRLTGAPGRAWRTDGLWLRSSARQSGVGLGQFAALDSTSIGTVRDNAWSFRTTWSGAGTVLDVRTSGFRGASRTDPTPPGTREGPPARIERTTNKVSVNAPSYSRSEPRRWSAAVNVTRLTVTGRMGTHESVAGVEYESTASVDEQGFPGGIRYFTLNEVPVFASGFGGAITHAYGHQTMLYADDRWHFTPRVTLTAGVRLEINRAAIPSAGTLLSTTPLAPRIGLAWDATTDHQTAVKLHFGRYNDALLTNRVAFMDIAHQSQFVSYNVGPSGNLIEVGRSAPLIARAIDPDIRHSYVDQYMAGVERQLGEVAVIQANYVHREFRQFMGMTDTGSQWVAASVQDPGPDGRTGTADDGAVIDA